jgi:hypothetical protein
MSTDARRAESAVSRVFKSARPMASEGVALKWPENVGLLGRWVAAGRAKISHVCRPSHVKHTNVFNSEREKGGGCTPGDGGARDEQFYHTQAHVS